MSDNESKYCLMSDHGACEYKGCECQCHEENEENS